MLERDEHVTIDCHQNHRQHGHAHVAVEHKWEDLAEEVTERPCLVIITNRLHRHHYGAKQKVGEGEREQESCRCVLPQTFTFQQRHNRQ